MAKAPVSRVAVPELEGVLRIWEDFWYVFSQARTLSDFGQNPSPRLGALRNFTHFRRALLQARNSAPTLTEIDFAPPIEMALDTTLNFIWRVPSMLLGWSRNSRRVYDLTEELEGILVATSLKDVVWKDVVFPFSSFGIRLPIPLIDGNGHEYSFIFMRSVNDTVNGMEMSSGLDILMIGAGHKNYQPISDQKRTALERAVKSGNIQRAQVIIGDMQHHMDKCRTMQIRFGTEMLNIPISETAQHIAYTGHETNEQGEDYVWHRAFQILVGLPLYLRALPAGSSALRSTGPLLRSQATDLTAVTAPEDVITVASCYDLDPSAVDGMKMLIREGKAAFEMSWHFREGHWRRPPGMGHLDVPRTVHVRPTIVRADRATPDSLPGGAAKRLGDRPAP